MPKPELHVRHSSQGFTELVVYMDNGQGSVQLGFCQTCGQSTSVICEHKFNTWHDEEGKPVPEGELRGVRLTCNLCGADGT